MPDLNSMKDECVRKLSIFESLLRRYDPTGVPPPLVLKMYDKWDNELSNALNSLTESVSNMTDSQKVGEVVNSWSQHVADSEKKYRDNMCATHAIVAAEEAKRVPSSVSSGPVVAAPVEETLSSARQVRAAEVKVKVEAKRVSAEGKKLDNEVKRYNDWGDASNEEIEEAMSSIEDWRKRLCKIQDRIYLMEENVDLYSLSSVELAASTSMVENLDKEMEIAIRDIKEQDEVRGLYSLSKSKASDVKLPRFSGKPHENFAKFKAEMLRCFKSNKIRKEDQVKKLRENLFDQPKTMVPFSMESIIDAWSILENMYGDPARVMNAKVLELRSLKENSDGGYPRKGGGLNLLKAQIEWITRLEVVLNGIMELGEESDQLDRNAFGDGTVSSVLELFPFQMQDDLEKEMRPAKDDGKEKLYLITRYLKEVRLRRQGMQKTQELRGGSNVKTKEKYEVIEDGTDNYGGKKTENKNGRYRFGAQVASKPNKNCKICKYFENHPKKLRGSKPLFAQHYGSGPGGCPRFMELDISMRREVVKEMQICNRCLVNQDPVPPGKAHAGCIVTPGSKKADGKDGRIRYHACSEEECLESFLLCDSPVHMTKNQVKLNKVKEKWKDRNIEFSVNLVRIGSNLTQKKKSKKKKKSEVVDNDDNKEVEVFDDKTNNDDVQIFDANLNKENEGEYINLKKATEKLRKVAEGSKVIDVPEGEPLFLFSSAVGKTRPVNVFYDKGCSHVVFREGVPQNELVSVMTKRGPLAITGVGDTKVQVKDEWACLLDKADGCKQVVQGVTVDHITAPYPLINISEAVKEVKAADPENEELQNLRVPSVAGGEADILFGILYESCHPVHVHTLPSGLFLAKLKLATPEDQWTGVIGGPHKSFEVLSQQAGDVTRLMAHFVEGIKNFETLGAPDLHGPVMTWEDVQFATNMNKIEFENCTGQELEFFDEKLEQCSDFTKEECDEFFDKNIHCGACGKDLEEATINSELSKCLEAVEGDEEDEENLATALFSDTLDNDEKLKELKIYMKMQELGLSIDYRCPACRSCQGCRNAPETEHISLREEAEDQAIRESVKIDFEKKKITCILPLRGKEEEFLSSNRKSAEKVLDSQCRKVQHDEEAKKEIIKSFNKLFDGGFAKKFDDLTEEQKAEILKKKVQHYLPWRVVYKASISTPCRTVMDASSKTPKLANGEGGRCLNDATMKGKVDTLDLLRMLLRFQINHVGFSGDLKQFYPSIALDPSQWNLQRVLWREGLSFDSPIVEIIILTLIFGVRAVSALSEKALVLLAEHVEKNNSRLAELLKRDRFVDDIGSSEENDESVRAIIKAADELFRSVGLSVKGWSMSGYEPHPEVTADGASVDIGGMVWYPVTDTISVKTPPLHFGKKQRGKISAGTEIFDGSFEDLKRFVKKPLTRRQIVSKFSAWYDPFGKFTPLTAKMKLDVSKAMKLTSAWDDQVPTIIHDKWLDNFWKIQRLRGLQFRRPRIPKDALNSDLHLIGCVDAADELKIVGVWAQFKKRDGSFSAQLVIGRSLLSRGGTIPKEELEAATIGSNLLWIVRKALEGMVVEYSLCSDSVISICWITSENKKLSLYHRNRVVQVRFHTELEKIYHVKTDYNPADIGTRPNKVKEDDVGPDSIWENGHDWMRGDMEEAVTKEILTPAKELRLQNDEKETFDQGLVFEKFPEILVKGHSAFIASRLDKMEARTHFSNYIFSPTKFNFRKVVRITASIFSFLRRKAGFVKKSENKFRMFSVNFKGDGDVKSTEVNEESVDKYFAEENSEFAEDEKAYEESASCWFAGICWGAEKPLSNFKGRAGVCITDEDVSRALQYWYKKGSEEVSKFNKKEFIEKAAIEKNGILFCKSRIMDGQRFITTGGLNEVNLGSEVQLNLMTPMLDRHSPIAYSIASFIHNQVGKHAGYETCYRLSLGYCHIIQGASLFREIGEECARCKMRRKKYVEAVMGPVSGHQLTLSPPFFAAFCDLDGPYKIYVPGHERETRNTKVLGSKVYIMCFACPVSKLVNLQVIESKSADGVLEGLTRLGCEHGFPKYLLLDQDTSFMKAVNNAEINLKDLQLRSFKEHGIICEVAPVSGHNFTGLVERKIRTVQEALDVFDLHKQRLHATGLQTLAKLVENDLNNIPLGFSYGRDVDNTPLLKLITPNLLKIGRLNSRALQGPVRFPTGPKDLMVKVEQTYDAFFKVWNATMVPKLLPQPKWFKECPELKPGDIIYFQKTENELSSDWTVGQVHYVTRSKDGVIRRVCVKYFNHTENKPRYTDRAVRSLVRLFNIEDSYFMNDMAKVEKLIAELKSDEVPVPSKVAPTKLQRNKDGTYKIKSSVATVCKCCCHSHCRFSIHNVSGTLLGVSIANKMKEVDVTFPEIYERDFFDTTEVSGYESENIKPNLLLDKQDTFYNMLMALETNFNLKEETRL